MKLKGHRAPVASYLRPAHYDALLDAARARDVSVAQAVREAILFWLAAEALTSRVGAEDACDDLAVAPLPPVDAGVPVARTAPARVIRNA